MTDHHKILLPSVRCGQENWHSFCEETSLDDVVYRPGHTNGLGFLIASGCDMFVFETGSGQKSWYSSCEETGLDDVIYRPG